VFAAGSVLSAVSWSPEAIIAGVAVTGAVFHALRDDHSFTYSLPNSFWVLVGVLAAGVVLTWAFVGSAPGAAPVKPIEHRLHHRRFRL
jgi:hypothetical protein